MCKYSSVIGLEIHIQLNLEQKVFSPERFEFGILPNSLTSEISLGYPGTLPILNKKVFESAIKLGLSCNSTITKKNFFSRKNYFYPDLPKGYQITQDETPICTGGFINFSVDNKESRINLTRIHIEEDAAKIQVLDKCEEVCEKNILHGLKNYIIKNEDKIIEIDFNRSGVALLEIVTEPEFSSGYEVFCFLHELRRIVRFLDICNGNMEEGSMRCDANISIMPENSNIYGQRVEVKNMNSIKNTQLAIEYEIKRQVDIISNSGHIVPETRTFDPNTGTTIFQRLKESKDDYKYFYEPDINPIYITEDYINEVKENISILPYEYKKKMMKEHGLSSYQAEVLLEDGILIKFYEEICSNNFKHYVTVANWLLGPIKGFINENKNEFKDIKKYIKGIRELILMVLNNEVNYTIAVQKILKHIFLCPEKDPHVIAVELQILSTDDLSFIEEIISEVLIEYKNKVIEYKNGKKGLLGFFIGEVFRRSNFKANPKKIEKILLSKI